MKRILTLILLTIFFFLMEFCLFNLFGKNFAAELLLLLVVFVNLSLGIRYALFVAIFAGILKDSFSTTFFFFYTFSFIAIAYVSTILRRYIYGSAIIKNLLLIFMLLIFQFIIHFILSFSSGINCLSLNIFSNILFPKVVSTLILTPLIFNKLKKCASKSFV